MFYRIQKGVFYIFLVILLAAGTAAAQSRSEFIDSQPVAAAVKKNDRPADVGPPVPNEPPRLETLLKKLPENPDDPLLHNELGIVYARMQNYDEALAALEKAVALRPNFAAALYNLSLIYDHLGRLPEALAAARKAVSLDPTSVIARTELCQTQLALKNFREAVPCYETLIEMAPPGVDVRAYYALALTQAGETEKGFDAMRENVRLFPGEAVTHNAYGMALFMKKKYKQAVEAFDRAVALNPEYPAARFNLAIAQLAVNNRDAALRQYFFLKNRDSRFAAELYEMLYAGRVVYVNKYSVF